MTKDEIKALIAAKIAGQGTNVDAGSVLPTILNGIIDLIPSGNGGGIVDVPFQSTSIVEEWTKIDVPIVDIDHAIAIRCSDGVILPSRLSTFADSILSDNFYDGEQVSAIFGVVSTSDVLETFGLAIFTASDDGATFRSRYKIIEQ